MITEDYCSYEVAKLLKEKGFDEACKAYYDDGKFCWVWNDGCSRNTDNPKYVSCPTPQMAMKWLRDVYDIHISVNNTFLINDIDNKPYLVRVCTKEYHTSYNTWQEYHSTYEEAVDAALKYVLENLI